MKCLERLILPIITQQVADNMDPHQFAYRKGRGVEDATALLTHLIYEHLEKPGNYARILFIDFSSAFNTMLPSILIGKIQELGVQSSLCAWIADYLHNRTQRVRVGGSLSTAAVTNIGAPQGCVLSPVLFTLYTNNHRGSEPHTYAIKYADDTATPGLISDDDETQYRSDITKLVNQCDNDGLELNVGKTKEIIIDFRRGDKAHVTSKGQTLKLWHNMSIWALLCLGISAGVLI